MGKNFILQVEEIYADVIGKEHIRYKEISTIQKASGYLFSTGLLNDALNSSDKPSVIIHGTYGVEAERTNKVICEKETGKIIHCVYAGTLDPRKGGAVAAAAAEFLPENYHIHIIGFGSETEKLWMKKVIDDVAKRAKAKVTYDGFFAGEEYIRFIQRCDIGLSTQNPRAEFNATSFPSKVLSYLTNGLHVVSIRIPAIEQSAVGDMLSYYEKQTAKDISKAIMAIDVNKPYDGRQRIIELDEKFGEQMANLIEEM